MATWSGSDVEPSAATATFSVSRSGTGSAPAAAAPAAGAAAGAADPAAAPPAPALVAPAFVVAPAGPAGAPPAELAGLAPGAGAAVQAASHSPTITSASALAPLPRPARRALSRALIGHPRAILGPEHAASP